MLGKSRLKYIQSLGHKKQRDQEGLFIAEGPKMAEELMVTMAGQITEIFALEQWITTLGTRNPGLLITAVSEEELGRMSQLATANQVITVLRKPEAVTAFDVRGQLTLALGTIQDPGNLGTIIRIADWFGVKQIVCSNETADQFNPKVVQSTMGSIGRVSLFYTELKPWLEEHRSTGVYAAALDGRPVSSIGKLKEGIIIIGSESRGIQQDLLHMVDHQVTIPRVGNAESLNAAVATGIILSHLA